MGDYSYRGQFVRWTIRTIRKLFSEHYGWCKGGTPACLVTT